MQTDNWQEALVEELASKTCCGTGCNRNRDALREMSNRTLMHEAENLRKFGNHMDGCAFWKYHSCDCGWTGARDQMEEIMRCRDEFGHNSEKCEGLDSPSHNYPVLGKCNHSSVPHHFGNCPSGIDWVHCMRTWVPIVDKKISQRDDLLSCGHEEWDRKYNCLSCLRHAVDLLNNRLSLAEARASALGDSAHKVIDARDMVLSVPQIAKKDFEPLLNAVYELGKTLTSHPAALRQLMEPGK